MKKEWEEPELIVIIKTELEEDVLAACKGFAGSAHPCTEGSVQRPGAS